MEKSEFPSWMVGKADENVAVVDPADVKAFWTYRQKLKTGHRKGVAIALNVLEQMCRPGADLRSVSYRCGVLEMLEERLAHAWTGGHLSDKAFKVAANMDLQWPPVGVVQNGLPYSLEDFLARLASN